MYPDKERFASITNDIFNISPPPAESFVDLHSHSDAYTILDGMFTDVGKGFKSNNGLRYLQRKRKIQVSRLTKYRSPLGLSPHRRRFSDLRRFLSPIDSSSLLRMQYCERRRRAAKYLLV